MVTNRAGEYVTQPGNYRTFIPRPLPPEPPIAIDDEMAHLQSRADRALGRLDGSTETLPNPDLFVFMYVRREAVLSSQIEGTQASLMDVLEFEAQALTPDHPQDVAEVVNYVAAMNYGLERLGTLPVSLRLIRELHERLMAGVRGADKRPGEFRDRQNWIGPPGSTIARAHFVPPPPDAMHEVLNNLEKFLHSPEPMPDLIKVGLAHAQFETIHPFLDGNGRVGRLLITLLLCERQVLKRPLLYLSHYFKRYRQEYYASLQAIRDDGNWEAWLKFLLRGVGEVSEEAAGTARRIVTLREKHRELLTANLGRGAGKALSLLEKLYFRPIISVQWVAENVGLSIARANSLVAELYKLGVLKEITGYRRNRRFSYDPYLALFRDEDPAEEALQPRPKRE